MIATKILFVFALNVYIAWDENWLAVSGPNTDTMKPTRKRYDHVGETNTRIDIISNMQSQH